MIQLGCVWLDGTSERSRGLDPAIHARPPVSIHHHYGIDVLAGNKLTRSAARFVCNLGHPARHGFSCFALRVYLGLHATPVVTEPLPIELPPIHHAAAHALSKHRRVRPKVSFHQFRSYKKIPCSAIPKSNYSPALNRHRHPATFPAMLYGTALAAEFPFFSVPDHAALECHAAVRTCSRRNRPTSTTNSLRLLLRLN